MVFVDGVSEYRGILGTVPPTQTLAVTDSDELEAADGVTLASHVVRPRSLVDRARAQDLVTDVQTRQINRSYLLRKPQHRTRRLELLRLPLWRLGSSDGTGSTRWVNAVTGDDERFLAAQWPDLQQKGTQSPDEAP